MAQFAGVWKLDSSENFEAYMKEVGVSWPMRKVGNSVKPVLTITVNGNHISVKQESTFSTSTTEFDLDQEFDEKTVDGRHCKSIVTLSPDGSKMIHTQKGDVLSIFTRYLESVDIMVVDCEANGVKCTRKYKRHEHHHK